MIPKVIHYCWFGRNPLPPLAIKCIDSWKKFFPDYEIKEWNEDNFDVHIIPYTKEAYEAKKYAFVSDYARFWILYKYGGIYFDTDVEVVKSFDDIISKGSWMGYEFNITSHYINGAINPGLGFGCSAKTELLHDLLDVYAKTRFNINGVYNIKTIVAYTTEAFINRGLEIKDGLQECCGFTIYPIDYFNPLNSKTRKIELTENTRSIHHYMASWSNDTFTTKIIKVIKNRVIVKIIPRGITEYIVKKKKAKRENIIKEAQKDK